MAKNVPVVTAIRNPDREQSSTETSTPELRAIRGVPAEGERATESE